MILAGMDLASRTKGHTVLALLNTRTRECQLFREEEMLKGMDGTPDADVVLLDFLARAKAERVGIDAPLTYPAATLGRLPADGPADYLARVCDRETGGMATLSPGMAPVAARGMYLRHRLVARGVAVDEVYPAASLANFGVARAMLKGKRSYRKDLAVLLRLARELDLGQAFRLVRGKVETHDDLDALVAVVTIAAPPEDTRWIGDAAEGQIRVAARRYWA